MNLCRLSRQIFNLIVMSYRHVENYYTCILLIENCRVSGILYCIISTWFSFLWLRRLCLVYLVCLVCLVCLCTQFISVFLPNKYLFPRHIFFFFFILTNIFMERTTRKEMEYIFSRFVYLFQDSYPRLLYRFHAPFSNFVTFVREYRYYRIFFILPSCMYVCGNFVTRTRYSTPRR